MKQKLTLLLALLAISCSNIFAQNIRVGDLSAILSKKNLAEVTNLLSGRKWYYDDMEENDDNEQTVTFAFEKNYYSEKARGWINVYFYQGRPEAVRYLTFNEPSFQTFHKSKDAAGYKTVDSYLTDDEENLVVQYKNNGFLLSITSSLDEYTTNYQCYLRKKGGHYDPDNGVKTQYDDDGSYEVVNLVDGVPHGVSRVYNADGQLMMEATLVKGVLSGPVKMYHDNGKLKMTGVAKDDQRHGLFKEYDEEGHLTKEYSFVNDVRQGPAKDYHPNGKVRATYSYKDDEIDGIVKTYDETGHLTSELTFVQGSPTLKKDYDELGNLIAEEADDHMFIFNYDGKTLMAEVKDFYPASGNNRSQQSIRFNGNMMVVNDLSLAGENIMVNTTPIMLEMTGSRIIGENGLMPASCYFYDTLATIYYNDDVDDDKPAFNGAITIADIPCGSVCRFHTVGQNTLEGAYECYIDPALYRRIYVDHTLYDFSQMYPSTTDTRQLQKYVTGYFSDGDRSGRWTGYYATTGNLRYEGSYKDGLKEGPWNYYREDGTLVRRLNYVAGKLEGSQKIYYIFDSISSSWMESQTLFTCSDGQLNGAFERVDPLTKSSLKGQYLNGLRTGAWNIVKGRESYTQHYKDDELHGSSRCFLDGRLVYDSYYERGVLVRREIFDSRNQTAYRFDYDDNSLVAITDLSVAGHTVVYRFDGGCIHLSVVCGDRESKMDYLYGGPRISFANEYDKVKSQLDSLWSSSQMVLVGQYSFKGGSKPSTAKGLMASGKKEGVWDYRFDSEGVLLQVTYSANNIVKEFFTDLAGIPYSGEFVFVDRTHDMQVERKTKNGEVKKTKCIGLSSQKNLKIDNPQIEYFPIDAQKRPF